MVNELEQAKVTSETERLRSALLSSVSHDLRSPLAAMIGSAMQRLKHYQPEVKIEVALAEELPQLYVHPALIEQAISNVLRHEEDTHYLRILVKKLRSKIGQVHLVQVKKFVYVLLMHLQCHFLMYVSRI